MLTVAGAVDITIESEVASLDLPTPEAWWGIVLGSGLKHLEMALSQEGKDRVRTTCEQWLSAHDVTSLRLGVNYAIATKSTR
jgi:hypothetical protein